MKASALIGHYEKLVDRESAYEKLRDRQAGEAAPAATGSKGAAAPAENGGGLMGSLMGMLDADQDGSVADHIAGLAQKFLK